MGLRWYGADVHDWTTGLGGLAMEDEGHQWGGVSLRRIWECYSQEFLLRRVTH